MFVATGALAPVQAASRSVPTFLRGCRIVPPDPLPLFPGASAAEAPEDEDDTDAPSDPSDAPRGIVVPGTGTCLAISGSVTAGLQRDAYKASARTNATGLMPRDVTSFPISTTFRLDSGRLLADGQFLATALEFSFDTVEGGESAPTLSEASITYGAFAFGLSSSRFDYWTGDDFIFVGRVPSRTVALIAYSRALTEEIGLSLSAEDTQADQRTVPVGSGRRFPDGVARLLYEGDALTVQGAVALREVPGSSTSGARLGRAALIGATWEAPLLGRTTRLSGQIAGAVDAAPYIGSQLDLRALREVLVADDSTRGWSGVVSVGRDWTDHWTTNAYVSRYDLALPGLGVRPGRIRIDRAAANLAARQSSVQLFLDRSF